MKLYYGEGIYESNLLSNWFLNNDPKLKNTIFVYTSPLQTNNLSYPLILDLFESLKYNFKHTRHSDLIMKISSSIAPAWEELISNVSGTNLSQTNELPFSRIERGSYDEAPILQSFLYNSVAKVISKLEENFSLVCSNPSYWDASSKEFLLRLIRERESMQGSIVLAAKNLNHPFLKNHFNNINKINLFSSKKKSIDYYNKALQYISITPQGLPLKVLLKLGYDIPEECNIIKISDNEEILFVNKSIAQSVSKKINKKSRYHADLYNAWTPEGWGYIRRVYHAMESNELELVKNAHSAYVYGISEIGFDFLLRHFLCLASLSRSKALKHYCYLSAARLTPYMSIKNGRKKSKRYYKLSLKNISTHSNKLIIYQELGNLLANEKSKSSLIESRKFYKKAFIELKHIKRQEDKIRLEITLCNGLALVEYHENKNDSAYKLMDKASKLIQENIDKYSFLKEWARPLINSNTAKLVSKRFNKIEQGFEMMNSLLETDNNRILNHTKQALARMYFDTKNYTEVVNLLMQDLESKCTVELSEKEELYDRIIFFIALVMTNQKARANNQINRIEYLSKMNDVGDFFDFVKNTSKEN